MQKLEDFYLGTPAAGLFEAVECFELDVDEVHRTVCEAALEADGENVPALSYLAEAYTRSGEYGEGLGLDLRLSRLIPASPVVWYNLGCSYSLTGDTGRSLEALRRALELGYSDVEYMMKDPDLEAVRGEPAFGELIASVTRRG